MTLKKEGHGISEQEPSLGLTARMRKDDIPLKGKHGLQNINPSGDILVGFGAVVE